MPESVRCDPATGLNRVHVAALRGVRPIRKTAIDPPKSSVPSSGHGAIPLLLPLQHGPKWNLQDSCAGCSRGTSIAILSILPKGEL
jgi:hypothetical protein